MDDYIKPVTSDAQPAAQIRLFDQLLTVGALNSATHISRSIVRDKPEAYEYDLAGQSMLRVFRQAPGRNVSPWHSANQVEVRLVRIEQHDDLFNASILAKHLWQFISAIRCNEPVLPHNQVLSQEGINWRIEQVGPQRYVAVDSHYYQRLAAQYFALPLSNQHFAVVCFEHTHAIYNHHNFDEFQQNNLEILSKLSWQPWCANAPMPSVTGELPSDITQSFNNQVEQATLDDESLLSLRPNKEADHNHFLATAITLVSLAGFIWLVNTGMVGVEALIGAVVMMLMVKFYAAKFTAKAITKRMAKKRIDLRKYEQQRSRAKYLSAFATPPGAAVFFMLILHYLGWV